MTYLIPLKLVNDVTDTNCRAHLFFIFNRADKQPSQELLCIFFFSHLFIPLLPIRLMVLLCSGTPLIAYLRIFYEGDFNFASAVSKDKMDITDTALQYTYEPKNRGCDKLHCTPDTYVFCLL